MTEEDNSILEFLMNSDLNEINYSNNQYIYFLLKYKEFYRLLNSQYHGLKNENVMLKDKHEELENQLVKMKRSNVIDNAKVNSMKKSINKKLTLKERILGKLLNRFDPDNI